MTGTELPPRMAGMLAHPDLAVVWRTVAARLEGNGLTAAGTVTADLSDEAADRLSGLLGTTLNAGTAVRVGLAKLDAAFRQSAAGVGLVSAVAALTGVPLRDRRAARRQVQDERAQMWSTLDASLAEAGLAAARWVPGWLEALRQAGVLTRAGSSAATVEARAAIAALGKLSTTSLPALNAQADASSEVAAVAVSWELGQLATAVTGDAHGLDDDRLASALTLKALAAATGAEAPSTPAQRRALWSSAGVSPDSISGTVIVYGVRPPGDDPWSVMMRARADLGLVTHLTVLELAGVPDEVPIVEPGRPVWVCENPQVLQAAARATVSAPVVCLLGNPATAGSLLIRRLVRAGVAPSYHGDFDWPGVAIAGRMIAAGCVPWRMSAEDYRAAVSSDVTGLPLSGRPERTAWDPDLSRVMAATNVAVHEEALLPLLLADLATGW